MSIFGPIGVATDLEEAILETLQLWFPTYRRELELQQVIPKDSLPDPKGWITAERFDRENTPLPTVVVINPGFARPPLMEGDGTYRCWFNIGIGVFVSGKDRSSNKRLVRLYTAILRSIMLHKQSLGGYASGVEWQDESYDDIFAQTDTETIGAGQDVFIVEVEGFTKKYGGPAEPTPPDPDTQPGSTWPEVETVSATVGIKED